MVNPTGYTALDLVGFTDRGAYSGSATYVKNDLVHYNGTIWRCLIDDTTGTAPSEGVTWTVFVENDNTSAQRMIAPIESSPSEHAYAIGDSLVYGGILYKAKTAIAVNDALVVGTNITASDSISKQVGDINSTLNNVVPTLNGAVSTLDDAVDTMAQNGAHNLCPNNLISQQLGGVQFQVNDDKSVTVNSNTTTSDTVIVELGVFDIKAESYRASGSPEGASSSTYYFQLYKYGVIDEKVYASDNTFVVASDITGVTARLVVESGVAIRNKTFYPMLTLASDPSKEYAPPAPTNQELAGVIPTMVKNGAHNLCPFPYKDGGSQTITGVNFTISSNGNISASGTANGMGLFTFFSDKTFPIGTYRFRFVGSLGDASFKIKDDTTGQWVNVGGEANTDFYLKVDSSNVNHVFSLLIKWSNNDNLSIEGGPLVCVQEDHSNERTPYTMTNRELTENKVDKSNYRYKDVGTWGFSGDNIAQVLHNLMVYAVSNIGFNYVGEAFTGCASWVGVNVYNFIVRKIDNTPTYDLMAWDDRRVFTARYTPNVMYQAYLHEGTAIYE